MVFLRTNERGDAPVLDTVAARSTVGYSTAPAFACFPEGAPTLPYPILPYPDTRHGQQFGLSSRRTFTYGKEKKLRYLPLKQIPARRFLYPVWPFGRGGGTACHFATTAVIDDSQCFFLTIRRHNNPTYYPSTSDVAALLCPLFLPSSRAGRERGGSCWTGSTPTGDARPPSPSGRPPAWPAAEPPLSPPCPG